MASCSASCKAAAVVQPHRRGAYRERGFTYLGLLYFLTLIALSSALTMEVASFAGRRNAEDELLWVGIEFQQALRSYRASSPAGAMGGYPSSLEELVQDTRFPEIRRHIRRVYPDPLTGKKNWGLIWAPEGGIMGIYSTAKGTPIKIRNFPTEFVIFEEAKNYQDWRFEAVATGYLPGRTTTPLQPQPVVPR